MEWALAHLEGVKSHCTYQVEINQPLPPDVTLAAGFIDVMNDTNVNSTDRNSSVPIKHAVFEAFSPEFLAKVEALSCMNECSGNGVCTNGKTLMLFKYGEIRGLFEWGINFCPFDN